MTWMEFDVNDVCTAASPRHLPALWRSCSLRSCQSVRSFLFFPLNLKFLANLFRPERVFMPLMKADPLLCHSRGICALVGVGAPLWFGALVARVLL